MKDITNEDMLLTVFAEEDDTPRGLAREYDVDPDEVVALNVKRFKNTPLGPSSKFAKACVNSMCLV